MIWMIVAGLGVFPIALVLYGTGSWLSMRLRHWQRARAARPRVRAAHALRPAGQAVQAVLRGPQKAA